MKKRNVVLVIIIVLSMILSGCGTTKNDTERKHDDTQVNEKNEATTESKEKDQLEVILLIPGTLGDKSFFDSANNGLKLIEEELGAKTKVVEMGTDYTKWEPNLLDAIDGDWDIIISGNSMTEMINEIAPQYPDERFINFDSFEESAAENVYAILYSANDLSFLAGACAALVSESDMELANDEQIIGFLGGMDIPGINDFLVGYIEGALYINENSKVMVSYAGDFTDPAKGKELSLIQYNSGVDISFNVAGGTGLGLLDAAKEQNAYAIGVDSDQALLFEETDSEKPYHIVTSAIKKIDQALLRAVTQHVDGTLEYGKYERLGVAEDGVGLAKNKYFDELLNPQIKATLEDIESKMISGDIEVRTAFGMSTEEINEIRDSVKPE